MNTSSPSFSLAFTLLLSAIPAACPGQALHTLHPYEQKPGEVMHIVTKSTSANGTTVVKEGETETKGTVTYSRDRTLERRVGVSEGRALVDYKIIADVTKTSSTLGSTPEPQTILSSLTGVTIIGQLDAERMWRFTAPDITPTADQTAELYQIEAYENNHLMPDQPVRLKQKWEIDPAFLRYLTERGIGFASVEAIARLDQIEVVNGEKTAIITFTVETVATEGSSDEGRGSGATIKAAGELHVSMKTMLDKKLVLYGTRTTVSLESGVRTKTVLPIRIEMTKTIGNSVGIHAHE